MNDDSRDKRKREDVTVDCNEAVPVCQLESRMNLSASTVLKQYSKWTHGDPKPLGNHGGFSGAQLWRIDTAVGALCLKAWPAGGRAREDLRWIHRLLTKANGFAWIPRVLETIDGETLVVSQKRIWELTTWMPGQADFASSPSTARVESACLALAQLHVQWAEAESGVGPCPAVLRRWQSWRNWTDLGQSGWHPRWPALDAYAEVAEPLFRAVQCHLDEVPRLLTPWLSAAMPLQPCVCDPWHDHVLFTGDAVTGLIDFGSVKMDHVAVDLARLLGSLIGGDGAGWRIGMSAYRSIRPLSERERRLTNDLDRTGTIVAATHWLRWLYHEVRRYDQPDAVTKRLQHLLDRITSKAQAQPFPGFA